MGGLVELAFKLDVGGMRDIHLNFVYLKASVAMQVAKWGNSLAVRLPAAVVEALELQAGDEIEIRIADRRTFEISRKPTKSDLLQRLRAFRGRLPADFLFDRDEANDR